VQFYDSELEYPSIYAIYGGTSGQMKKLRHRRRLALSALLAGLALIAALPAVAAAAETGAETPSGPVEPVTPETTTPPATGWVPQGSGTEGSGGAGSGVRQGSSLGSGGGKAAAPHVPATSEAPTYEAPSSGSSYYPSESASEPTGEEPTSVPEETTAVEPVEPPPPKKVVREPVVGAIGAGVALTKPEVHVAGVRAESAASAVPVASQSGEAASGPDYLWWIAIVICGLLLLYAGARLILEPTEPFKR